MANSSIISDIKTKVIDEIIHDEALFYAINSPSVLTLDDADLLTKEHLFRYNQNPTTINKSITFLTFQVHIPRAYKDNTLVKAQLEIYIISHETCMNVKNIPKIVDDRNDYISKLLDDKFNGRSYLGIHTDKHKLQLYGSLDLISNTEGAYAKDYLYRRMIFETKDVNDSLCDGGKYVM